MRLGEKKKKSSVFGGDEFVEFFSAVGDEVVLQNACTAYSPETSLHPMVLQR